MKSNRKGLFALVLALAVILSAVSLAGCNNNASGTVTITVENGMGGGEYDIGAEVTVTAIVPNGKSFINWTVDGKEVSKQNPYTFKAEKDMTITANLSGSQSGNNGGGDQLTGDWADAVFDENLEVTINWWRMQPLYFVGDKLSVSEYPVESFTDERANEVDDYETMLRIVKEGGAEETVSNADGYTFTEAGKYTVYRYALKDGKYAKSKGFEIRVVAPDGTAPENVELHNAAVVGTDYVLKRSTVNGSMGNILEGTADFSYVAFTKEGGYGPGTWVSVTFTGKNRPNIGMFFDADHTLLSGKTGFIAGDFATYDESGSQAYLRRLTVFDYASIGMTGDIISNPVRPATFSGGLDGVNDLPCAWNLLDDSKTYEYVVGSKVEPVKGSAKNKLTLIVELYEIGEDGAKTLVYSQSRDITNNGEYDYAEQAGDIVLFGSNKKEIAFSAKLLTKDGQSDDNGNSGNTDNNGNTNDNGNTGDNGAGNENRDDVTVLDDKELYKATVNGTTYTLKQSLVNGSMGNILEGTADFSYVAFTKKGGYGPGTWVSVTFTGKNRPNIGMFLNANSTLLGGKTGFILGDFAAPKGNQTFLRRLTVFDYANINSTGDLISNPLRPATFTGENGVDDLPCAWNSLDDSKTYEYVVGTRTEPVKGSAKNKLKLIVELYEIGKDGTKTLVYSQDRDITNNGQYGYANQTGDIVLFGSNMKDIQFTAKVFTKEDSSGDNGGSEDNSGSEDSGNTGDNGSTDNGGNSDDTDDEVVVLNGLEYYKATVAGTSYTLKQSLVNGSMGNILEGIADFSYVAFTKEGGYGPGTWVSVTFTGKNRPNIGMFLDANSTLLGGTTGFILGDFAAPKGNQTFLRRLTVFDYANINTTGDLISNPLRPATFTGENGVNDLPCAWNSLDDSKTYEYVVGTRTEPVKGSAKNKLKLIVELYEIGKDGTKTLVYSQDRDITNNGQYDYANQTGDIVLFGSNMKDIQFSATLFTKNDSSDDNSGNEDDGNTGDNGGSEDGGNTGDSGDGEDSGNEDADDEVVVLDGLEYYKATVTGTSYALKQSLVNGSMGNILDGIADFSYVAFTKEGGYGPGTWVSMSFTGKNRPNVGMFFDANSTLLGGTTGFITGDFAVPNSDNQVYLRRLTVFDYANINTTGDLISNPLRPATFTGENGVNDLPCAWNSLDDNKTYEYIIGSWTEPVEGTGKSKLVLMVQLYEIGENGAKTLIYSQDRDITNNGQYDYANQTGDIVLFGTTLKAIEFSARLLTEDEVNDIRFPLHTVTVTNGTINGKASDTVRYGQTATVIANAPQEGKRFVRWVDATGAEVSTSATYEFTVTGDISLTAVYEDIQKYTVTVVGGTIDGATSKEIEPGTSVTVVADAPEAGKVFAGWKIGESVVSTESTYTFTPEGTLTITAVFEDIPAEDTVETNKAQQNPDGTFTIQTSGLNNSYRNDIDNPAANLDWGYVAFKGDYGVGSVVSVTFTGKNRPNIGFGHDATNKFDATTGFIIGGSVSGDEKNRLSMAVMNNIATGRNLLSITDRVVFSTNATSGTMPAFNNLDDNKTYEYVIVTWQEENAAYGCNKFMVGVVLLEIGSDGTKTCVYQQSRDINIDGKYNLDSHVGDIVLYGTFDKAITFSARVVEDPDEIAKYKALRKDHVWEPEGAEKYVITVVGGTIDGATGKEIEPGTSVTVVADVPEAGKVFAGWKIGESIVSTESTYTFTPEGTLTITAVFEDIPAEDTVETNKAQQNPDGTFTIQTSGLTVGNRDNIYGAGANLDWGYVAFKGDYGAGTMVSVTFTGKNRPSFGFGHDATNTFDATTGFILGGSTSGGVSGTKGRLQIFNMNNIHTTGKLISTPNRIAYTGTPLDPSVTATSSTDSIAPAFNYLDDNKTYEFVVGTWTEDTGTGTKKFMVNVILFEIAEDGTRTCIYQQSRDANDNGRWAYEDTLGDVVLYGTFDQTITFSARLVEDPEEIAKYNAVRKDHVWEPATGAVVANEVRRSVNDTGVFKKEIHQVAVNFDWGYVTGKEEDWEQED